MLTALLTNCRALDDVHMEWTALALRATDRKVVSVGTHSLWSRHGRALHTRWQAEPDALARMPTTETPDDAQWAELDRVARSSPPQFDLWDGVRHTRYAKQASQPYVASVLARRQVDRFCPDHLAGLLYYAGTRIDGLGPGWAKLASRGSDDTPRRGFGAPETCFYLAFGAESVIPRWSLLWNQSWASGQGVLDAAASIEPMVANEHLVFADEVVLWAPPMEDLPRLPLLVRHVRPHVGQVILSRLRSAKRLRDGLEELQLPASVRGAPQVYWDELTNEGYVIDESGERRPLHPGSGAQGPATPQPPPLPLVPPEHREQSAPARDAPWRLPALVLGVALLLIAAWSRVRSGSRK